MPSVALSPAAWQAAEKIATTPLPQEQPPPVAPPQVGPTQAVNPNEFTLQPFGGGGVIPAHEVDTRGPTLTKQQDILNADALKAAGLDEANSRGAAANEYDTYLNVERDARAREAASMQSMAERDEELSSRMADFDQSVKALSKMSLDPNRFWASRSTGQKVAAMVSIALGGFVQGARGGSNAGLDMINTAIDRDIKAQEFAYHATRDTAQAKQTAFSMAMQKYNNVDAARAMARASALDAVQAQLGQNAALWKDAEAANRANDMVVQIDGLKAQQIGQGIRFLPTQVMGRRFIDPRTGLTYTEAEAKALSAKMDEREFERQKIGLTTAGKMMEEDLKGQYSQQGKTQARAVPPVVVGGVQLPGYAAASEGEAKDDRESRKAGAELVDMIDKALKLRREAGLGGRLGAAVSPVNAQWENEVTSLSPQIGVAWSKTKKLGTYDKGVEALIGQIQGNPRGISGASDEKLTQLRSMVMNGLAADREVQTGESRKPTTLKLYGDK